MTWGAIGAAGIGAVGGALGGGGGSGSVHSMDSIPRFLRDDYERLAGGIEGLQTPEYYQGQLVAGQNPWMQNSLAGMGGWGAGMGGDMMNQMYGAGQAGLGGIGKGMNYLDKMRQGGPNQFKYDQGTYNKAFNNLSGGMQNAFDQGATQMQQGFDWGQLPGLNMSGALGGAQGSTKQYQQGALGQAMTNQNIQNFGTNMWQNAANQANQNAMSAGAQNLSSANAQDQNIMSGYGQMGQLGGNLMNQGYNMGVGNLGLGLKAGQIQQGYDQSLIDAEQKKWNFEQQAPWLSMQNKLGMMPSPGGVQQGTPGMSAWEGAMQGINTGLGIYQGGKDAGWWGQPAQGASSQSPTRYS